MQVKVLMKKINEKHVRIVEKKDITELHVNSTRTSVIYLTVSFKIALHYICITNCTLHPNYFQ